MKQCLHSKNMYSSFTRKLKFQEQHGFRMGEITAAVACFNNGFEVMDSILLKQYASQLHLLTGHTVLNKTNVAVPLSAGVWQSLLRLLPRMQWPSFAELVLMRKNLELPRQPS